jgi:hypothetical protein
MILYFKRDMRRDGKLAWKHSLMAVLGLYVLPGENG